MPDLKRTRFGELHDISTLVSVDEVVLDPATFLLLVSGTGVGTVTACTIATERLPTVTELETMRTNVFSFFNPNNTILANPGALLWPILILYGYFSNLWDQNEYQHRVLNPI